MPDDPFASFWRLRAGARAVGDFGFAAAARVNGRAHYGALESSVDRNGDMVASRGWTDIVITPERGVRVVDGLLTGLHEPRASHLQM